MNSVGVVAAITTLLLSSGALGEECIPGASVPEVAVEAPTAGTFYADADCWQPGCPDFAVISIWVYQESNGIAGLQRADEIVDDTCGGQILPDTLLLA